MNVGREALAVKGAALYVAASRDGDTVSERFFVPFAPVQSARSANGQRALVAHSSFGARLGVRWQSSPLAAALDPGVL